MKSLMKVLVLISSMSVTAAFADVAVIVHPSNSASMSQKDIARMFLGKSKSFPNGTSAIPVNQDAGNAVTEQFNDKVVNKSSSQLKAYWSKLVFTGKGTPPQQVDNDAEVKALVSSNPGGIGYVDAKSVDGSVKVIATF